MRSVHHVPVPVAGGAVRLTAGLALGLAAALLLAVAVLLMTPAGTPDPSAEYLADGPALPEKTRPLILVPHPRI